jgi:hypothetical protein
MNRSVIEAACWCWWSGNSPGAFLALLLSRNLLLISSWSEPGPELDGKCDKEPPGFMVTYNVPGEAFPL